MEALGNLGRRLLAWIVLAVAAIILLKIVFGIVAGFVQAVVLTIALVVAGFALIWALNRL
jgi:hypothetical protein